MAEQQPPPGGQRVTAEQRRRREHSDAVKRWAQRKLDEARAKSPNPVTAAAKSKRTKGGAKRKDKTKLSVAIDRAMVDELVTPEAQRHGNYQFVPVKLQEVTEGGKRVEKEVRAVRNLGGTPIERWHVRGVFDDRQMKAILFYMEAYRKVFGEGPRITASYSPVILRGLMPSIELYAGSAMAARESLRLLDHEVFLREPFDHFCVWQNVVIWEKPSGVAGAGVGFVVKKSAEAAARVIVCGMAHKIANIIIDQPRSSFSDLLVNLDTPRKARGRRA